MVKLTSQEQPDKDGKINQSTEVLDKYDDTSSGSKAETILITVFATIVMGILIFLFR
jgi:hypothetical protein